MNITEAQHTIDRLTAHVERLRKTVKEIGASIGDRLLGGGPLSKAYANAVMDTVARTLASTPEQSLEAIRAEARREAEQGKVSSTFGDLVKACETISHRIESHVWDNMPMWEQRDWAIAQAEILHRQWAEKWRNTLDRESDGKAELQAALEADRIAVIDGVNRLTKEIESRAWLMIGSRGSFEWNDERYQQEFRDGMEAILKALEPLRKVGADLSGCPASARASVKRMRSAAKSEARREMAEVVAKLVPELRAYIRDGLAAQDSTVDDAVIRALDRFRAEAGRERAIRELEIAEAEILYDYGQIPTGRIKEQLRKLRAES